MPRKSKLSSKKSNKKESFEPDNNARPDTRFSGLKSIDKLFLTDPSVVATKRKKELQLQRKAKRRLNTLKILAPEKDTDKDTRSLHAKTSRLSLESAISNISEEFDGRAQLMKLRSEFSIVNVSEADVSVLEKLLDDHDKSGEEEEIEEFESEKETSDSYVEDQDVTIERVRKTFKKSNVYVQKGQEISRENFFEALGGIPSIENISLDLSYSDLDLTYGWKKSDAGRSTLDIGHFVDPLTGASLESSVDSLLLQPEIVHEPSIVLEDQDHDHDHDSEVELIVDMKDEADEDLDKVSETDFGRDFVGMDTDDLGKWFGVASGHIGISDDIFDPTKTDYFVRQMIPHIYEFVNQLINKVVEAAQYSEPATLLRQSLNKKKIMDELYDKIQQLAEERKANTFLNKKVVEYHRRKKDFRSITEDPPEKVMPLIEIYNENMEKLSTLSSQEEKLKHITSIKISNLNEILQQEEEFSRQSVENLEKLIKKTIVRDRFENMNELVTRSLKYMASTREEVSKQRFMLLRKLHTLAKLKEKADKLENLGNGLNLQSFEHLQADTTNLGQKDDERAQELNRLHIQRNKYLHIIANMRERHKMLRNTLEVKESALKDLLEEKHHAREWLNYQKIYRKNLRNESESLIQQSGLTGNTALMLDYDETTTQLEETRARVTQLKMKYDQLLKRFSKLELRYSRVGELK